MKKLFALMLCSLLALSMSFAQSKTVKAFQEKYENDRDASVVHLNSGLFKIMAALAGAAEDDEDAEAIARISDGIKSLDIVSIPFYKSGVDPSEVDNLRRKLKKENYEELMEMKDGRDRLYFLTQGDANEIKNMVVLVREEEKLVVMNLDGVLNMKDFAYMAKHAKNMR